MVKSLWKQTGSVQSVCGSGQDWLRVTGGAGGIGQESLGKQARLVKGVRKSGRIKTSQVYLWKQTGLRMSGVECLVKKAGLVKRV